jgi:hypothetical protein
MALTGQAGPVSTNHISKQRPPNPQKSAEIRFIIPNPL